MTVKKWITMLGFNSMDKAAQKKNTNEVFDAVSPIADKLRDICPASEKKAIIAWLIDAKVALKFGLKFDEEPECTARFNAALAVRMMQSPVDTGAVTDALDGLI